MDTSYEAFMFEPYKILKTYPAVGYTKNHIAADEEGTLFFILQFLPKESLTEPSLVETYEAVQESFIQRGQYLNQMNIKHLPQVIEVVNATHTYIVFKKQKGASLVTQPGEEGKVFPYKEAYEMIFPLFRELQFVGKAQIYFHVERNVQFFEDGIILDAPFSLYTDEKKQVKEMANVYYRLITGNRYVPSAETFIPSDIVVPPSIETLLSNILSEQSTIETINQLMVEFETAIMKSTSMMSEFYPDTSFKHIKKDLAFGCVFLMVVFSAVVYMVYYVSGPVVRFLQEHKDYNIEIGGRTAEPVPEEEEWDSDYSEDDFIADMVYYYNLDFEYQVDRGLVFSYKGDIYYNFNVGDTVSLYKENIETGARQVVIEDIQMAYMTIYDDIIYFSNTDDDNCLYSVGIDGENIKKISDNAASYIQVNASEKQIYYVTLNASDIYEVRKVALDGTGDATFLDANKIEPFLLYLDLYNVIQQLTMEQSRQLGFPYSYDRENYVLHGDLIYYIDSTDYLIKSMDLEGNEKLVPYIINATSFVFSGDYVIYVDAETAELKAFHLKDATTEVLHENVYIVLGAYDGGFFAQTDYEDDSDDAEVLFYKAQPSGDWVLEILSYY